MKEETPKDITPIKRKGIELAVKGLNKTYPFIIGYKDDESDQYESAHYVDLIVDLNKLSDYMGVPINPYWSNELKNDPRYQKIYAIWSYLKFPNEEIENDMDITKHPGYILGQDITHLLNTIYEYLPEQYKLYYEPSTSYITPKPIYPVSLKINGYIMR
jgi:hypothetical protein